MTETPNFENRHFLVVDDEEFMARTIMRMLKACNAASAIHVQNGSQAMYVRGPDGNAPDCVICDFNMQNVNGLQLLQGIRCGISPYLPRSQPFIMVTGHSGYAVKPVAQAKLAASINKALSQPVTLKPPEVYKAVKLPKP